MSNGQNMQAPSKQKQYITAASLVVILSLVVFIIVYKAHQQPVGQYNFNIPGSTVLFLDNGQGTGNEKVFTVKGQKTTISIDFNDILAYKGQVNLDDIKAQAESWRTMQTKYTPSNNFTEKEFLPFDAGKTKGFYQLAEVRMKSGRVNELRNLFFLRNGQPYQASFSFLQSDVETDKKLVSNTWKTLLDQFGIPLSALPITS